MKALLNICLFLSVLESTGGLRCKTCLGVQTLVIPCRSRVTKKCPANTNACKNAVVDTNMMLFVKGPQRYDGCRESHKCHPVEYSITAGQKKYFQYQRVCCEDDLCNDEPLELPSMENRVPNGLQCPACFKYNATKCESTKMASCHENENKCIDFAGEVSINMRNRKITFQGCSTESFCELQRGVHRIETLLTIDITRNTCSMAQEVLPGSEV